MMVAIAIEQVFVSVGAIATAVTMELGEQVGIVLRDLVGLPHLPGKLLGIQRPAQVRDGLGFARPMACAAGRSSGGISRLSGEGWQGSDYNRSCEGNQQCWFPNH